MRELIEDAEGADDSYVSLTEWAFSNDEDPQKFYDIYWTYKYLDSGANTTSYDTREHGYLERFEMMKQYKEVIIRGIPKSDYRDISWTDYREIVEDVWKEFRTNNKNAREREKEKSKELEKEINKLEKEIKSLENEREHKKRIIDQKLKEARELLENPETAEQISRMLQMKYEITTFGEINGHPSLFDLRNIPTETTKSNTPAYNSRNFRGVGGEEGKLNSRINNAEYVLKGTGRQMPVSKSYYMNKDFLVIDTLAFRNTENEKGENGSVSQIIHGMSESLKSKSNIQPLIINEFQPYDMLSPGDLIPGLLGAVAELGDTLAGGAAGIALSIGKNYYMNKQIDEISENPDILYSTGYGKDQKTELNLHTKDRQRKYFTTDPIQVIQNMFNGGKWLNTYQIPFYGNDYLMANFSKEWNITGSEAFLGSTVAGQANSGSASISTRGFGIDFPGNPKFTPLMTKGKNEIKSDFYLVNSNTEWLVRNFQFIQAFFAGTSWLHMKYCQIRPPNVYHVLCPGRFQIYWAAIDVSVTFEGKLRKNVEAVNKIKSYVDIHSIDEDMLWPEAWKVSVSIRDLTPNNFNLYAEYYAHGFKASEIRSLEEYIGITDALKELSQFVVNMIEEIMKGSEELVEGAKDVANDVKKLWYKITGGTSVDERYRKAEKEWLDVRGKEHISQAERSKKYQEYEAALKEKVTAELQEKYKGSPVQVSEKEIQHEVDRRMGRKVGVEKVIADNVTKFQAQLIVDKIQLSILKKDLNDITTRYNKNKEAEKDIQEKSGMAAAQAERAPHSGHQDDNNFETTQNEETTKVNDSIAREKRLDEKYEIESAEKNAEIKRKEEEIKRIESLIKRANS